MVLQQRKSYLYIICLIGSLLLLLTTTPSIGQSSKRYKGSSNSRRNKRLNGGKRHNKVHKNIRNKKARRTNKHNHHTKRKRNKQKTHALKKANKGGKKKNTIARKTKTTRRKNYGGRYPSSKNQFGTKLEALVAVGGITNNQLASTENSIVDNVAEDNKYGIHVSGGVLWHANNNIGIQLTGGYSRLPNEDTHMELTGGELQIKWNLTSYNNKFSPFVMIGGNMYNWEYQRENFSQELQSGSTPTDEQYAPVTVVKRNYELYNSGNELLYGLKIGVGFDYKINQNIGTYFEVGYNYNQNLTQNNVNITFNDRNVYFNIGVKISLIKNKSLY